MPNSTEPQVSKLHIDQRIRRILLFEIFFVIALYVVLFVVSNFFLGQQARVTDQILSRSQMTSRVQNIERLMVLNSSLVRSYKIQPDDKKFDNIVKNHSEFGELLDKTKDELETLRTDEAAKLSEEIKFSDQLIKNYLAMVSTSNALLGKNVLSTVAAHKTRSSLQKDFPAVTEGSDPATLEQALTKLEEDSLNIAANWRTLTEQDITRLQDKLTFAQKIRTTVLVLQALLVIIGVIVMSYAYVLPSFEKILKQVIAQNEELLRADSMKTEFISIASHQLRTPLSVIKWSISLLLKDQKQILDDGQKKMLEQSKESAETVIQLVGNLLNLSRIEQGRLEHHPQLTDIIPIIDQIVKDATPLASERKITIKTEYVQPSVEITVDPLLFKEVIQNLIDNAICYNRDSGLIKLSVRKKDDNWAIDVADNGYGIMPEDIKNLFTKFYRGMNARTIRPNGSGLGLYFIRRIVELHGGQITVESEPNQGTIFTVLLPLKGRPDEAIAHPADKIAETMDRIAVGTDIRTSPKPPNDSPTEPPLPEPEAPLPETPVPNSPTLAT